MAGGTLGLTAGSAAAVVGVRGAALRSWMVNGVEQLSWFSDDDPRWAFDGAILVPWPNRVAGGRYVDGGEVQQLEITEPSTGSALHGVATGVDWDVAHHNGASVRLRRDVGPAPGYPHDVEVEVTYSLGDAGLTCSLTAINHGDRHAPFGAGAHPYLAVAPDDVALGITATSGVAVDDCFAVVADPDGIARVRAGAVTLWTTSRYVHVYTDDKSPEPRRRLALEPVTCPPNAFNTREGLVVLAPGDRFRTRWGLSRQVAPSWPG